MKEYMSIEKTIGQNIKDVRKHRGMTLQQVAEKAETSPIVISRYERGKRNPDSVMLMKLAISMNVHIGYFYYGLGV